MPAITPPSTVLVTGASGFIAVHTIQSILDKGFHVVGTVRSASKGHYLEKLFGDKYPGKFSFAIVEDIQKEGAFDEVVKGVDAVEHTASPFHVKGTDPQDYYGPAIQGTVGVLESVLKNGSSVKRVVITSSVASILGPKTEPYVFTEDDWNTASPAVVEEKGKDAPAGEMYSASKTLAERAAWDFVQAHSHEISWDLVTILPPYVFGPTIHAVQSIQAINTSIGMFHSIVTSPAGASASQTDLTTSPGSWVDVRDVAQAHAEALVRPEAGNQRFVVSAGGFTWQHFLDAINSAKPALPNINKGYPGTAPEVTIYSSGAKAEKILGIKYHDIKSSGVDTARSLQERFPQ